MTTCQPKIYRERQVLARIQTDCGTLSPVSADDGLLRIDVGSDSTPEMNMNERNLALRYLSKVPNVPGAVMGKQKFTSEIVGPGSLSVRPEQDAYLRACGLRQILLSYVDIKVPPTTTAIARNAIIVGATSGATGRIVIPVTAETTRVFFERVSGNFQADESINVQGGATGVFDILAPETSGGTAYAPISKSYEYLTIVSEEDGLKRSISDAMGTFSFSAEASGIGRFEWEFSGVVDKKALSVDTDTDVGGPTIAKGTIMYSGTKVIKLLRAYDSADTEFSNIIFTEINGTVVDNDVFIVDGGADGFTIAGTPEKAYFGDKVMTDITYLTTIPPILQDADVVFGSFSPVFNSISFDVGNSVIMRPNANSQSGLVSAYISDRSPSGSIDPEIVASSDFDFMNSWFDGDLYEMSWKFGSTEGNSIHIFLSSVQAQSLADQERETMAALTWDFEAKGVANNEFELVFV